MSKAPFHASPYYFSFQKRLLDIFFASLVLVACWPIILLTSVFIFFDSAGPVLFFQKRKGHLGVVFTIYKLRTMKYHSASQKKALIKHNQAPFPMFKMKHDPRYTRIGQLLSRSGIDELPQVINILKGDMSWIGPRPLPIEEAQLLGKEWEFRYQVKPGIVSEWAIHPARYESLSKWRVLELETLEKGGLRYDLLLFYRTFKYLVRTHF